MLEVGTKAPDFELPDQNEEMHKLSDYAGKKVILYFYPKDNTAGCTKQACGFSERYPQFLEKGAVILGVSKDTVASHKKFQEKYGLAFTLLADPERKVIEAYDVWKEKKKNTTDVISLYSFFGAPGLKTIPYRYACGLHAGTGTGVCGTCDGHSGFFTGDRFL